jgi:hypothetical protein
MLSLPPPRFMPCEHCGASLDRDAAVAHECELERRLDFELFQLRGEIESFGATFGSWLETPRGRFEQFYAEHTRLD